MKIAIVSLVMLIGLSASAAGNKLYEYQLDNVVDGDTFKVMMHEIPEGYERVGIRLAGVDTPELFKAKCDKERDMARVAKRELESILRGGKTIRYQVTAKDSFGRYVSKVYVDGRDVGDLLVNRGLAVRYSLGQKTDWCGKRPRY